MAADIPVILHNGNSNDRSIAAASSSVNSSNNVFEKPYQPDQTYCFPKQLFGKKTKTDTVICYICVKHNQNGNLDSFTNKDPAFISTGFCNWQKAICFEVHRVSKCHKTSLTFEKTIPKCKDIGVMFNSDTERKRETERKYFR